MKKIKYIIIFILSLGIFNSCLVDDTAEIDGNDQGFNVVGFDSHTVNLAALVDGTEKIVNVRMKLMGPTIDKVTSDITYTVAASSQSTAVEGVHYRLLNPTITLKKANNYLADLEVTMITEGNKPVEEGEPGYEDYVENYVAPILELEVINVSGDANVVADGKPCNATLSFMLFNKWAGVYAVEMRYFHPTAGGSYPPSVNPDDPYGGIRHYDQEMIGETSTRIITGFGVWQDTNTMWLDFQDDGATIVLTEDGSWGPAISLGDPDDPSHVTYWDPDTRILYLYYWYGNPGAERIFWSVWTPKF